MRYTNEQVRTKKIKCPFKFGTGPDNTLCKGHRCLEWIVDNDNLGKPLCQKYGSDWDKKNCAKGIGIKECRQCRLCVGHCGRQTEHF